MKALVPILAEAPPSEQQFTTFPDDRDPGHHHDPSPVPEPSFYGVIAVGFALLVVLLHPLLTIQHRHPDDPTP